MRKTGTNNGMAVVTLELDDGRQQNHGPVYRYRPNPYGSEKSDIEVSGA